MNNLPSSSLKDHYHQPDLTARIAKALQDAGMDLGHLQCSDLELLDEFHIRGKQATRDLAVLARLQNNHQVLDLGCGIGGPARFLAQEFGCRVLGLDLVASYCEAATELTRLTGLADLVRFQQGDMGEMPLANHAFDRVWSQHSLMNIPNLETLAAEVKRVLRPDGKAVFYEVCAGNGTPVHLPVAWASIPEQSHLRRAEELRNILVNAGMVEEVWEDVTDVSLAWLDAVVANLNNQPADSRPRPGLGLLMGKNAALKSKNLGRNLREGRIVVVRGVFKVG